jgi:nitrite reductase/ring-hydroxylating ferredoxin subunit
VTVTTSEVRLRRDAVPAGAVIPFELDGDEYVVWRAGSGELCAMARQCPHLDWDLAEAWVDGDELVCPGHGWAFDTEGHAYKRNLLGRVDAKDEFARLDVHENGDEIVAGGCQT